MKIIFPPICTLSNRNPFKMGNIPQGEGNTSSAGQNYFSASFRKMVLLHSNTFFHSGIYFAVLLEK
jgi:hypothetical protein